MKQTVGCSFSRWQNVSRHRPLRASARCSILHEVLLERDGLAGRSEARFGVIMLDEGVDDENAPISLLERLAFHIDLDEVRLSDVAGSLHEMEEIVAARQCLADVQVDDDVVRAICEASLALGIVSPRALILTLRAARAAAALAGHREVSEPDVAMAAALVLGPRATVLPPAPSPEPEPSEQNETPAEFQFGPSGQRHAAGSTAVAGKCTAIR